MTSAAATPSLTPASSPAVATATASPATPPAEPSPAPIDSPLPTRPAGLPPFGELVASARPASYEQLVATPARFEGDLLHFRGRVRGVEDDGRDAFEATIAVVGGELVIAYDAATYFGHPLVRGDNVRFVGTFRGLTTDGAGNQLPLIDLIEIVIRFT